MHAQIAIGENTHCTTQSENFSTTKDLAGAFLLRSVRRLIPKRLRCVDQIPKKNCVAKKDWSWIYISNLFELSTLHRTLNFRTYSVMNYRKKWKLLHFWKFPVFDSASARYAQNRSATKPLGSSVSLSCKGFLFGDVPLSVYQGRSSSPQRETDLSFPARSKISTNLSA